MFYNKSKIESKHPKVKSPGLFLKNLINVARYDYTIKFTGNVQDAKGCTPTIDSSQHSEIAGNAQKYINLNMCFDAIPSDGSKIPHEKPFKKDHIFHSSLFYVLDTPFLNTIFLDILSAYILYVD